MRPFLVLLTPDAQIVRRDCAPVMMIDIPQRLHAGIAFVNEDRAGNRAAAKLGWVLYDVQKWGYC